MTDDYFSSLSGAYFYMAKAKKVAGMIKLQIPAGKASPAPPIGPALGQRGINIMGFCQEFNSKTQKQAGDILPTVITVYADKSFSFITKSPPASELIKKKAGVAKGAQKHDGFVGSITAAQVEEIAQVKLEDLNAYDVKAAAKIIAGTARSMGIEVTG